MAAQKPLGTKEYFGLTNETIGFYVCGLLLVVLCSLGATTRNPLQRNLPSSKQIEGEKSKKAQPKKSLSLFSQVYMKTSAHQVSDKMNKKMGEHGSFCPDDQINFWKECPQSQSRRGGKQFERN